MIRAWGYVSPDIETWPHARRERPAVDADLLAPLWDYPPPWRPTILRQRQRAGILQHDPEPTGDVEYS